MRINPKKIGVTLPITHTEYALARAEGDAQAEELRKALNEVMDALDGRTQ